MTVGWCEFVDFTLIGGKEVSYGMWRYKSFVLFQNNDGTEIYKVDTCTGYSDNVPMDAYWKTSRYFSIIAPVLGFLATVLMCVRPSLGKALGGVFIVVTTCQGLVFLFFKSDACDADANPLFSVGDALETTQEECEMGSNAIMCIIAIILWFIAAIASFLCVPKSRDDDDHVDKDVPDKAPEAEEVVETEAHDEVVEKAPEAEEVVETEAHD
jgi:hypothetical protein